MSVPVLSVVIPSVNGYGDLRGCLQAVLAADPGLQLEIIVPERCGDEVRRQVRAHFPDVRLIEVDRSTTIPRMRAMAFDAATAPAVAVIEDHVIVPGGWARRMLDALGSGDRVVGGSVENAATGRLIDWAAFLCEYSHCLPPLPAGPAAWLTGNNVVYPRALLEKFRDATSAGRWENHLHESMRREGIELVCHPEIVVGHKKHYTFGEYFSQRFLYSRSYAGARAAGAGLGRRVFYAAASLALPPLLLYRTVARIAGKAPYRGHLARSLPLISLFVVSWGAGEFVGYLRGPGDSLSKVC